ncbi:MAG TPA: hypothetical protein VK395_10335 [Gemmataceae bacterium]|nr:hypothetical protein [Gemmataceae bacterium]
MPFVHVSPSALKVGLRWTARLLGVVLVGLVLVIFVGEGGFNPFKLSPLEAIQMTLFLTTCFGLVVAWRWQVIGGAISTGGMLLFLAVEFWATGGFLKLMVFYLMLLSGILFVVSGFVSRPRSVG